MGDINAKIEINKEGLETIMGIGQMNEIGDRFTEFCQDNILVIGSYRIFPYKNVHKVT